MTSAASDIPIAIMASDAERASDALRELRARYNHVPPEEARVIVALGGDGFMLHMLRATVGSDKMIYGMNRGTIGFLMNEYQEDGLIDRLKRANKEFGVTLFVIEHNMRVIMNLADRITCLAHGQVLASGTPDEVREDPRVLDAYLGAQ